MSFDYDRIKNKEEGTHWATYSDLFMVLSLVFLLLYVVASLRSGTSNLQSYSKHQEIIRERDQLKEELAFYQNKKDDYLTSQASAQEQAQYEDLMKKMELLREEARDEKIKLRESADQLEKKEVALNRYQKMIKNIITANIVSSVNIKRRDKTISKNFEEIDSQKEEINKLEQNVKDRRIEIVKSEAKIRNLNKSLQTKMAQLKKAYKKRKISKAKMEAQLKVMKEQNQLKVSQLELSNAKAKKQIRKNEEVIKQATERLRVAERTIATQEKSMQQLVREKQQVIQNIAQMRESFNEQMQKEKKAFQAKLAKEKISSQAKAEKQKAFLAQSKEKETQLASQIQNMESQVQSVQSQLEKARKDKASLAEKSKNLEEKAKSLSGEKQRLASDLQKMKEIANARKKLIYNMKKNLAKSGLKASVDSKTGDVIIQFGDEYFDTGRAQIKPGMEKVLKKFMPAYSETLFSDSKTAEKISFIEVIGYASPTYKGKYVNPISLEADNKEAVNYNLDLSYYRARSIFDYIFDTKKMKYKYQKKIRPMVKVTGRSFLSEGSKDRDLSSMSHKEYCAKFDCKKSQRVVIKFNMEN